MTTVAIALVKFYNFYDTAHGLNLLKSYFNSSITVLFIILDNNILYCCNNKSDKVLKISLNSYLKLGRCIPSAG